MSFRVALAVDNFARVEEVGHLVLSLSPEVVFVTVLQRRRLRGLEVSVWKHCASRALAQVLRAAAARKPRLPLVVRVLNALSRVNSLSGALAAGLGHAPREIL